MPGRLRTTWKARLDEGGIDALGDMAVGRPGQLDGGQLEAMRIALMQGAIAHGCGTELWTLKRVGNYWDATDSLNIDAGTIVDATIIGAPSSTKYAAKKRDREW